MDPDTRALPQLAKLSLVNPFTITSPGIAGAGMNPLARLMRARGHRVQGSDRSFDQGKNQAGAAHLRRLGIEVCPHDGSAIDRDIDRFIYSTAVEADTPEMRAARASGDRPCSPAGPPGRGGERGPARRGDRGHQR